MPKPRQELGAEVVPEYAPAASPYVTFHYAPNDADFAIKVRNSQGLHADRASGVTEVHGPPPAAEGIKAVAGQ
jgi:hypothetical protein